VTAAVELRQQGRHVGGDDLDHVQLQGFVGGQADRFAHGALGPVGVAAAQLGQAAQVGGGIVDLLAGHGRSGGGPACRRRLRLRPFRLLGRTAEADFDRRRRAQVGAGRHRRDVAGVQDISAGAGGAGAARGHVGRHRQRRGQDRLDGTAHQGVEAAGRVHFKYQELVALGGRALDAAHDVVGAGRADRAVDGQQADAAGGSGGGRCRESGRRHQR